MRKTQELDDIIKSQARTLDDEEEVLNKNMGCSIDCLEFALEYDQMLKSFKEEAINKTQLMPFNQNGMKQAKLRTVKDVI
jgi:hypothetical protein